MDRKDLFLKALLLFAISFCVFNLNFREIFSQDSLSTKYLPVSIIREGNLDLDEFPLFQFRKTIPEKHLRYEIQLIDGHVYSSYPIGPAVVAVPVYLLPALLGMTGREGVIIFLSKLSASLMTALSVFFLYLILRRIGTGRGAFLISLAYAFGTACWPTSSQTLWQHGPAQMFLTGALYFIQCYGEKKIHPFLAGIFLASAVACRPALIFAAAILSFYVLLLEKKEKVLFLLPIAGIGALVVWYNLSLFGHILGGEVFLQSLHPVLHGRTGNWSTPFLEGFTGLLFSPNRGIFYFSPFLLFAIPGMGLALRGKGGRVPGAAALAMIVTLAILSKYSVWWGGWTYGPRYLADILPLAAVCLYLMWERIRKGRILRIVFALSILVSVAIQAVGAFCYDNPIWNSTPESVDHNVKRVWDFSDLQIIRVLKEGPRPMGFHTTHPRYWLAMHKFRNGDSAGAMACLEEELLLNPLFDEAWALRGRILLETGQSEKALKTVEEGIRKIPDSPALWIVKGLVFLRLGRNQEGEASFSEAIRLNPSSKVFRQIASLYQLEGRAAKAEEYLKRAGRMK